MKPIIIIQPILFQLTGDLASLLEQHISHDLVPVDGKVIQGQPQIDESSLTGEPLSKTKKIGNNVFSGY